MLTRNGTSTCINIPRWMLFELGWLPGESVILQALDDKSLLIRRPSDSDFAPKTTVRVLPEPVPVLPR